MLDLSVNANDAKPFSVSIDVEDGCDEVLAWTIDTWENCNILSEVFRLEI